MVSISSLPIKGYNSEIVPNTFFQQHSKSESAGIIFPGWGYTAQMPLLFYCVELLLLKNADVLTVDYEYNKRSDFKSLDEKSRSILLYMDVQAAYRFLIAQHAYKHIIFIGKSLGTMAMGYLLTEENISASIQAIWLTPLIKNEKLREEIKRYGGPSLFVCGTDDPHYDAALMSEVQEATKGQVVLVNKADHLLNIKGDVKQSISELERVMDNIKAFVD